MDLKSELFVDERGAAFLEGVAVAPVLGVLLVGVVALNAMYLAKLEAKSRARRLAWLQADSADCPPQTCAGERCEAVSDEIRSAAIDPATAIEGNGISLRRFLGRARDFFLGTVTRGMATATRRLPNLLRKQQTEQQGTTILLCNARGRSADSGKSTLGYACSAGLHRTEYAREVCD